MSEFAIGHDVLKDYLFRFLNGNRYEQLNIRKLFKIGKISSAVKVLMDFRNIKECHSDTKKYLNTKAQFCRAAGSSFYIGKFTYCTLKF